MRIIKGICLCLVLVLLAGCVHIRNLNEIMDGAYVPYDEMTYSRPDMDAINDSMDAVCACARDPESLDVLMDAVITYYDAYDAFYTNLSLADIRYSSDLTDFYWEQEYACCAELEPAVEATLDTVYGALADSPLREELEKDYFGEDFFAGYEGDSTWDPQYLELLEQEAALIGSYYTICGDALEVEAYSEEYFSVYGTQLAQLYVELIALRQQIAAYAGYSSYADYAYDWSYYRDYTPKQAVAYLEQLPDAFYDLYVDLDAQVWTGGMDRCSEVENFAYLQEATQAMGGLVEEAFDLLEKAELYDIAYSRNKYDISFETYLWSYGEPFIFLSPYLEQSDKLTLAHEFGHFANDYACSGSYAGTDVCEVHSQAFEFLSLCYTQDTQELAQYKLADSLCTFVECGAQALFEHRVYELTGDELTAENVQRLYEQICLEFGFDSWAWDSRDYVTVSHYFTNPMYMVSYVFSCDVAMQFYALELQEPGAGLELYEQSLYSEQSYLIEFAQQLGLDSPFDRQRLQQLTEIFSRLDS